MECPTCGEQLREGARFCPTCGTPTAAGASTTTPPTVQVRRPAMPPAGADASTSPGDPAISAQRPAPEPGMRAEAVPPPRAGRDPGAGYNPVGPPPRQGAASGPRPAAGPRSAGMGGGAIAAPSSADITALTQRATRLLRMDTSVFGELYADRAATVPAAIFAAVVLLISGLGGMLFISNAFGFDTYELVAHGAGEFFFRSVLIGTLFALAMTLAWSWITAFALNQVARVNVDFLGLFRVFCFALAPLVLAILLVFDDGIFSLSWIAFGAVASLAVVGVLESVDVRPGHAWLATIAGFIVFIVVLDILGHDFRDFAPGFFAVG